MNFSLAVFLGALQGITEFFPISSSGHLLLAEHFFSLPVENFKAFDVVLHAGTLLALLVLFWREWFIILRGFFVKTEHDGRRLFLQLVIATLPAAFVGFFFGDVIDKITRGENRVFIMAGLFAMVALALLAAEKFGRKKTEEISWQNVIKMGLAQSIALLPGVSRSGVTIVAGMLGGATRSAAAKFSFLMLAPATAGAIILIFAKVFAGELILPAFEFVAVGFIISAIVSYIAASIFLGFVRRHSLVVFAIYLLLASASLVFLT